METQSHYQWNFCSLTHFAVVEDCETRSHTKRCRNEGDDVRLPIQKHLFLGGNTTNLVIAYIERFAPVNT